MEIAQTAGNRTGYFSSDWCVFARNTRRIDFPLFLANAIGHIKLTGGLPAKATKAADVRSAAGRSGKPANSAPHMEERVLRDRWVDDFIRKSVVNIVLHQRHNTGADPVNDKGNHPCHGHLHAECKPEPLARIHLLADGADSRHTGNG